MTAVPSALASSPAPNPPVAPNLNFDPGEARGRGWALWLALGVVALGGGSYAYLRPTTPKPRFESVAADTGTIVAKVTSSGTLSALVTVQVGSQVSGRLSEIFVDFNSTVKKGDLIAKLDPALYQAQVDQNAAALLTAKATVGKDEVTVKDAERTFRRQGELRDGGLNAQQDLDTAETAMLAARAQLQADLAAVANARANLEQSRLSLSYTRIYAPISGTVISRAVDVGQTVAASFQAPTLFTIAQDLTHMQVDSNVAESDVGKLRPKMTASFTVDAFPSKRFTGTVRQIRNAANVLQNVVTYDAVLDVANPDLELRPGMTANITLVTDQKEGVLRVPNAALRFKPPADLIAGKKRGSRGSGAPEVKDEAAQGAAKDDAKGHAKREATGELRPITLAPAATPDLVEVPGMRTVYLAKGNSAIPVRVRIGVSDGTFTEIAEGPLAAGDLVITGLAPGGGGSGDARGQKMRSPF